MRHTKHLWRAMLILLALGILAVSVRHFLIPESFGKTGHFRFDSMAEYMAYPAIHGGDESCAKCHEEESEANQTGKHAAVRCETCHGPVTRHANKEGKTGDALLDKSYEQCAGCHRKQVARPESFPQVELRQHLLDQGLEVKDEIPINACTVCHEPHDPGMD